MKQKSKIVELLMQYKLGYIIILALITMDCIATYLYPNYLSAIIDTAIPEKNAEMLIKNIVFLAIFQILSILASVLLSYMFTRISNSVIVRIKEAIVRSVFRTDGEELSAKARSFTTGMNGDIDNIEILSSRVMAQLILQITTVFITGVILIKINKTVMYFVLAAYPILIATQIFFNKKIEKRASILMTRCDIGYSLIKEFVTYIYEYIVLNADNYFLSRFMKNERNIRKGQLKYNMLLAFNGLVPQIVNMTIYLMILTISGYMVMEGSILPGEFTIILLYTQRMFNPIANIMAVFGQMQGARVSLKRIDNMLIGCEKI
ncbi:ABC transporter ATP-binding protein [Lachnospiraceae bacterium DSM 108991]|uniref:ABC transporter ATP-binding protein n=1 Tax=Claveliimonas monacensis TaxID=2779351 RepID=A0ABR9RMQ0_9FIRM|nr:ABC transporter ATP-binding protein [Claveliimonas monacensis]MBE5064040.1 ABC transporter ATP-binding protein [Claveliimonas monacensis]